LPGGSDSELPSPSVQQAYAAMMREQIAPALRELGFTGSSGVFSYGSGGSQGHARWQKDARQWRQQRLRFTVNVGYWWASDRISQLMPEPTTDTWWEIRAGQPVGPVADSVVTAVRRYALPAIKAGLDDLGHQRDPEVRWTRAFPPVPDLRTKLPDGGGADPGAWFVAPAGTAADEDFAAFTSGVARLRLTAAENVAEAALGDPRAVAALLDRLACDPAPLIRKRIASRMLTLVAGDPLVRAALAETAACDEDPLVRWAARYALRLDLP
jgi:hypothetical protein